MKVYQWVLGKKLEWEERLLIRQRRVLLRWIEQHGVVDGERVIVAIDEDISWFQYSLTERLWKRSWSAGKVGDGLLPPRFVLCTRQMLSRLEKKFGLQKETWVRIFGAETFEVWESREYYEKQRIVLPLRLGLSNEEKRWITSEVRRMMGDVLAGKEPKLAHDPFGRIDEKQDLDVAVWVKGRLRASVIMIDMLCREALEVGAKRATWDKRFAPLTKEEFPEARIEITFMSDLLFPVLQSDFAHNRIDPTKGYMAELLSEGRCGWYLPEVHNTISFPHLYNFLYRLATEKSGISTEMIGRVNYQQFEVFDWVDIRGGVLTLSGPTPEVIEKEMSREEIRALVSRTVSWLRSRQEMGGNIRTIFSQKENVSKDYFPSGPGCVGHALALYSQVFPDQQVQSVVKKLFHSMKQTLVMEWSLDQKMKIRQLFHTVYYLRMALVMKEEEDIFLIKELVKELPLLHDNPILWLQILSLLADYEARGHTQYRALLRAELKVVEKVFRERKEKNNEQLALYPELIALYARLWRSTQDVRWRQKALDMSRWYEEKQQEDGSFPHSPGNKLPYTRGSSKIFEVLACFPQENKVALGKCFSWIASMEYTADATFFMSETEQAVLVGGFRHDAFNREAWSDASAHILLGVTRFLAEEEAFL